MRKILWSLVLTGSLFVVACGMDTPLPNESAGSTIPSHTQNTLTNQQLTASGAAYEFERAFSAASAAHGVPIEILRAIAYTESGFTPNRRTHAEEVPETIGVMGLRSDVARGAHVRDAARAARVPEAGVAMSMDTNILAAAAWLRQQVGPDVAPDDLLGFWDAVATYSGIVGPAAQGYAADVYALIADAKQVELLDGSMVAISAAPITSLKSRIDSARASVPASPDWGPAAYSPACSSNYTAANRNAADIKYVVIHVTQGSYSGAISWFGNCSAKVSAHYVIRSSDGAITQTLLDKHIGWHAGNWSYNQQSIGIEHEGWVDQPKWFTDAMYKESAKLTAALCDKYGIPKTRTYIIGHVEVPGATHTDPGKYWDWDKYMAYVTGKGEVTPPPPATTGVLKGFIREGDIYSGPNISGASVKLNDGKSTTTNSNGLYSFTVSPGTYTVTVSKSGYVTKSEAKDVLAGVDNWKSIALIKETPPPPPPPPPDPEPEPEPEPQPEPEPDPQPEPEPEPVEEPAPDPVPDPGTETPPTEEPVEDPTPGDPQPDPTDPTEDPGTETPPTDPPAPTDPTDPAPEDPGSQETPAGESNGFGGGFWAPQGAGYTDGPGAGTGANNTTNTLPTEKPLTTSLNDDSGKSGGCTAARSGTAGVRMWCFALGCVVFARSKKRWV